MKLDWLGCWAGDLECLHGVESVAFLVVCCARIVDCNFLGLRIEGVWSALCLCPEDEMVGLAFHEAVFHCCVESVKDSSLVQCNDVCARSVGNIVINSYTKVLCSQSVTDCLGLHSRKFRHESHTHFRSVRNGLCDLFLVAAQCQHCQRRCKNVLC